MIINGVELEDLDIYDVEVAEKYEKVIENINKNQKFEGLKDSVVIRKLCEEIFNVFNELFGEGTDRKVFVSNSWHLIKVIRDIVYSF